MSHFPLQTGRFNPRAGGRVAGAHHDHDAAATPGEPNVALILGVTGIVGNYLAELLTKPDAPGGPWKVYGVARRPRPDWIPSSAEYVQVNLLDRGATMSKIGALTDVTHVFFVTWVQGKNEKENIELNSRMLQNPLDAVLEHAPNLKHIALQTGGKQYTGPFELTGKIEPYEAPFVEDVPRLPCDQYYHNQEDIVFDAVKRYPRVTYSIHRPTVIMGFAAGNLMNIVATVAVYALICKQEGKPLMFPGNEFTYERLFDASDAELIAEQEIWASVSPTAKNQALNTSNGDVFKWKSLWKQLAARFGLEVPEYKDTGKSLEEMMQGKEPVWDEIVKKYKLEPTKLSDLGHWWFADFILNQVAENVSSMNKSKELGFMGWRDTDKCFLAVLDKMKANNLIP